MEIAIVSSGMAFGPDTLETQSLGGSEQAALMVAKSLRAKDHVVSVFTPLPPPGRADHVPSGHQSDDGIMWASIDAYANFIGNTEVDLLIVLRDPGLIATTNNAKKRVLWMHDLATHRGMQLAFDQMAWTFDEIWTVSEFHRQQVHKVTGYPLKNIFALRNGILPRDTIKFDERTKGSICYAARPERGLDNLIKPEGIMEHLTDYDLKLSMYANYPDAMQQFYEWCNYHINRLPNADLPEELNQQQMRQRLAEVQAYVYPTQFEETSCLIARECIEQRTPFLTTRVGALPETLGNCGVFFEDWLEWKELEQPEPGCPAWCKLFADFVRDCLEGPWQKEVEQAVANMEKRDDLYWEGVADMMLERADPAPVSIFSRAWSLIEDGAVIPAYHYLRSHMETGNYWEESLLNEIETYYPFILDPSHEKYVNIVDFYDQFYLEKKPELGTSTAHLEESRSHARWQLIREHIAKLPDGSTIYEYGCGEGHVILPLAQDFPQHTFVAFDMVEQNVEMVDEAADAHGLRNLHVFRVETPEEAREIVDRPADAVICVEVIEHCLRPWEVVDGVEKLCKPGGRIILTTPSGPWEPNMYKRKADVFHHRNHIWHFDKSTIRKMFKGKKNFELVAAVVGRMAVDDRVVGNYIFAYDVDHVPVQVLDPIERALAHPARQAVAAAIIAYNNEDTILKMLNSLERKVQIVQIALGPCTDSTPELIKRWFSERPWMRYKIINAPKIEAPKRFGGNVDDEHAFGFDDARNLSVLGLDYIVDWILWIDTDEYLVGHIGKYLRHNCLDGYLIPQHHFTVEPRGGATQIDKPARLMRTRRGFKALGKIHEHFEMPGGGPGHCFMPNDVDIGHTGYENETVRRGRFSRNFPFLKWDHENGPDRKLHPFLWFRDLVHQMRYCQGENDMASAVQFAEEAEKYYLEHEDFMQNFGAGLPMALMYLAEVRGILGKGVPVEILVRLEDGQASFQGMFMDTEEITKVFNNMMKTELERRQSKYY